MWILLSAIIGCGGGEPAAPPPAADKCPHISLEGLAGDWLQVKGQAADHTHRFRIMKRGERWSAWYVGGFFKKVQMEGALRAEDLQLTEALDGEALAAWKKGERARARIYVQPYKKRCAMRVSVVDLKWVGGPGGGSEKESTKGGAPYVEYLPVPEEYDFTYRPCDEPLYLARAAKSRQGAKAQAAKGGPEAGAPLGEQLPVGTWSDAKADGPEACAYTMDLYFDDRPLEGGQGLAAGDVVGGERAWYHEFYAPYSGNHHFEMYRHRQCDGGARELIAVACIEGVLN